MLNSSIKELEKDGLVIRKVYPFLRQNTQDSHKYSFLQIKANDAMFLALCTDSKSLNQAFGVFVWSWDAI